MITSIWTLFPKYYYIFKNVLTLCVVFLFCFAWACAPFIATFFRLSICVCPFGILYFLFTVSLNCPFVLAPSVFSNLNFLIRLVKRGRAVSLWTFKLFGFIILSLSVYIMKMRLIWNIYYWNLQFCLNNAFIIKTKVLLSQT